MSSACDGVKTGLGSQFMGDALSGASSNLDEIVLLPKFSWCSPSIYFSQLSLLVACSTPPARLPKKF